MELVEVVVPVEVPESAVAVEVPDVFVDELVVFVGVEGHLLSLVFVVFVWLVLVSLRLGENRVTIIVDDVDLVAHLN